MASHSNDNNVYKPKVTGFLIAAVALVLLIVVVLASTLVLISSASKDDAPSTTTASALTSAPEVSSDAGTTTADPSSSSSPQTSDAPVGSDEPPQTTLPPVTDSPDTPTAPTRVPTKVSPDESTLTLTLADMNEGSLLLLDKDHTYQKDPSLLISRTEMGNLAPDKLREEYKFSLITGSTGNYTVAGANRFINSDALYYFNEMMADYAKESGNVDVQVRNGYYYSASDKSTESMEHSTGYYVDLQIFRSNGTYPLNYETLKAEYYNWFATNCWKYGYIHIRDTASYSTFRFVGAAHAAVMNKYGFNLNQYVSAVTVYTSDSYLSITDGFGWEWRVYYVKATGESTSVPVIGTEDSYDISGNNLNGYIVAINTSCFS